MRLVIVALLLLPWPGTGAAQTRFRFPAVDPSGTLFNVKPMIHVDHDPVDSDVDVDCVNYEGVGFPWCYDQHNGTDFLLIHGFGTMDEHDVAVVAGADGVVIEAVDGNYDRCHGSGLDVSCDGYPMIANRVELQHADGLVTRYFHLKKGSVKVTVGQSVTCGDLLGYVGSSGRSALPHLHFEVQDSQGAVIDPFAGPYSQPTSYWTEQEGPLERPGDRCEGQPAPPDAGAVADGLVPDGGPVQDSSVPTADLTTIQPVQAASCGVGGRANDPLALLPALLVLVGLFLRRGPRTARRSCRRCWSPRTRCARRCRLPRHQPPRRARTSRRCSSTAA